VRWSSVELVRLPRLPSVMDARPPFERRGLDDVSGFTARLGSRRSDAITRSVLASSTAAALLGDRCWADRQPGMPAVGMPKLGGFPQVCVGCAACACSWLNDTEEVRLDKHAMDVDTAEALAGVVGLPRHAWAATDRAGARSPGHLCPFGVDLAADQARDLVPDVIDIDGPVPACGEPAGLLMSAEQVSAVSWQAWTPTISISSLPCCGMPAAAARHVVPQMTR
jgi:hypothetical protein